MISVWPTCGLAPAARGLGLLVCSLVGVCFIYARACSDSPRRHFSVCLHVGVIGVCAVHRLAPAARSISLIVCSQLLIRLHSWESDGCFFCARGCSSHQWHHFVCFFLVGVFFTFAIRAGLLQQPAASFVPISLGTVHVPFKLASRACDSKVSSMRAGFLYQPAASVLFMSCSNGPCLQHFCFTYARRLAWRPAACVRLFLCIWVRFMRLPGGTDFFRHQQSPAVGVCLLC